MLRFTKKADYGLMAIHYIAAQADEEAVSTKRIASHNGPKGGYLLGRDPDQITVGQVIRALEGPVEIVGCVTADDCPQYVRCNLRRPVEKIQASISHFLDTMTLAERPADPILPVAALSATT